ncbi:hypothetical protein KA529_03660 [Candidatus Saccharibacteria bacterium]|jgi:hypothetical protein|nr:hypothetical protein [Candidatus Saccharibacteria bacterium]
MIFITVFSIFSGLMLLAVAVIVFVFQYTHKLDYYAYGAVTDKLCSEEGLSYHKNQILNQDKNESISDPQTTVAWLDFSVCEGKEHPDEYQNAIKSYFNSIGVDVNWGD